MAITSTNTTAPLATNQALRVQQTSADPVPADDNAANLAQVRHEYSELRTTVSKDYDALGGKIRDMTQRAGARALGVSEANFESFSWKAAEQDILRLSPG